MIHYRIPAVGDLLLMDAPLARFHRYRQTGRRKEAGGQLFATFEEGITRIVCATGPRHTDRRRPASFIPDRLAERREIRRLFKRGLHYIGDWHTHPELEPTPSNTDIESFREMFCESRHSLLNFVMVIVGVAQVPDGLYVGLCNGEGMNGLHPTINGDVRASSGCPRHRCHSGSRSSDT